MITKNLMKSDTLRLEMMKTEFVISSHSGGYLWLYDLVFGSSEHQVGISQEIELAAQIDSNRLIQIVGTAEHQVSVGEAVQAMVLNALDFTDHPH
ncbi:MAG: DUF4277 domain-containing protein [Anaerolineae bacterium]